MDKKVKKGTTPEKKHICQECGASFLRPYRLTQHLLLHNNIKTFVCGEENCDKSYTSKSHLDRHILTVHIKPNFDVINRCPECMKVFSNRQNLKRHIKIKHVKRVVFTCDVCKANFKKKHLLSTHMYYHTYVKSFRQKATIRELLDRKFEGGEENDALSIARIEKIVAPFMPDDWKDWLVEDQPPESLLGHPPERKLIRKLRYAIPTTEIARAFDMTELSEGTYRRLRMRLINWPFARALIYAPHEMAVRIHGDNLNSFTDAVKKMKPYLLGREAADNQLNNRAPVPRRTASNSSTNKRRRRQETTPTEWDSDIGQDEERENGNNLLANVIAKQTEMFREMLCGFTHFINVLASSSGLQNQAEPLQDTSPRNPLNTEIKETDTSVSESEADSTTNN